MCFIPCYDRGQSNLVVSSEKGKESKENGTDDKFPLIESLQECLGLFDHQLNTAPLFRLKIHLDFALFLGLSHRRLLQWLTSSRDIPPSEHISISSLACTSCKALRIVRHDIDGEEGDNTKSGNEGM